MRWYGTSRLGPLWSRSTLKEAESCTLVRTQLFVIGKILLIFILISWVLIPGTAILPNGLLAVVYGVVLCYLFMGISIVADLFMAGIEKITS